MEEEMFQVDYNGGVNEGVLFYTAYEIDIDYEFDAAHFFDFIRGESPLEIRQAEAWFNSATGYPPSPFVARLVQREEILRQNVKTSSNCRGVDCMCSCASLSDDEEVDHGLSTKGRHYGGSTFYHDFENNVNSKGQTRLHVKSTFPWTSTLMKPSASHLAKQNHPFHAGYSRSHTPVLDGASKTSTNSSGIENQAAKRQKLEGGLLLKVMGAVQLQQANFVHKAPKSDKSHYGNIPPTKPRFTIPRDPDLETARRAQRAMERSSKVRSANSTVRRFKALPLNRKILETSPLLPKRSTPRAPEFQEFHLMTSERAAKQRSSNGYHHNQKELHRRSTNLTESESRQPGRLDGYQSSHSFRALPLSRKTSTSKRDIGACRSSKNETTVPMEFSFQTEKRSHPTPPVDLFNKLSLLSETQPAGNPERHGP